jgi:hypothetical protein
MFPQSTNNHKRIKEKKQATSHSVVSTGFCVNFLGLALAESINSYSAVQNRTDGSPKHQSRKSSIARTIDGHITDTNGTH